jgi:hypothetical protein
MFEIFTGANKNCNSLRYFSFIGFVFSFKKSIQLEIKKQSRIFKKLCKCVFIVLNNLQDEQKNNKKK